MGLGAKRKLQTSCSLGFFQPCHIAYDPYHPVSSILALGSPEELWSLLLSLLIFLVYLEKGGDLQGCGQVQPIPAESSHSPKSLASLSESMRAENAKFQINT